MFLKLTGDAKKIQLFEISEDLFDELKSNKELKKEFKIPFERYEEGKTWTKLPTDFKYSDKNACKEVFNTIIYILPQIEFEDDVFQVDLSQWEEGVEFKKIEEKYALDDKRFLLLLRNFSCGAHKFQKGSLGTINTPEKKISINKGFSVVEKKLWFGFDLVEECFEISYRDNQYGEFNELIFDSTYGSTSYIIEKGKVAEWWNTLAEHEMKDE